MNLMQNVLRRMLRLDVVLLMLLWAVIAAVLFPVFAKPDTREHSIVLDGTGKPIPGAVINFMNNANQVLLSVQADARGRFRQANLRDWSRRKIAGYACTRRAHSTGGNDSFFFTPIGVQEARFTDTHRKPVPNLPVDVQSNGHYAGSNYNYEEQHLTDADGIVRVENIGVGEKIFFIHNDSHYVEQSKQVIKEPRRVRFNITLAVPGHIHGRLTGKKGVSLRGYMIFLTRTPDLSNYGERIQLQETTEKVAFARDNLAPGIYYLSASPPGSNKAIDSVRRFTIASGQHLEVELPLP